MYYFLYFTGIELAVNKVMLIRSIWLLALVFHSSTVLAGAVCSKEDVDNLDLYHSSSCKGNIEILYKGAIQKYPGANMIKIQSSQDEMIVFDQYKAKKCTDKSNSSLCEHFTDVEAADLVLYPGENVAAYDQLCKMVLGENFVNFRQGERPLYTSLTHREPKELLYKGFSWDQYVRVSKKNTDSRKDYRSYFVNHLILKSFMCRSLSSKELQELAQKERKKLTDEMNRVLPFQIPEAQESIFVLDMSNSVLLKKCEGIRCAKYILESMKHIISIMRPEQRLNIVFFGGEGSIFNMFGGVQPMNNENKHEIYDILDQLIALATVPEELKDSYTKAVRESNRLFKLWDTKRENVMKQYDIERENRNLEAMRNERDAIWDQLDKALGIQNAIWNPLEVKLVESLFEGQEGFVQKDEHEVAERLDFILDHAQLNAGQDIYLFSDFAYFGVTRYKGFDQIPVVQQQLSNVGVFIKSFGEMDNWRDEYKLQVKELDRFINYDEHYQYLGHVGKDGDFEQTIEQVIELERQYYAGLSEINERFQKD